MNSNDNSGEASQEAAQKRDVEETIIIEDSTVQEKEQSLENSAVELDACEGGACSV